MDNLASTTSSQPVLHTGNPLNPQPISPLVSQPETTTTIESIVSSPLEPILTTLVEPIGQINPDGNVQAHFDVNYQAHDVALASVKVNSPQPKQGLQTTEHHKIHLDDDDGHPEKAKSCYSMLNKLFLASAIVSLALFLCAIAYILNGNSSGMSKILPFGYDSGSFERSIPDTYFNLTEPKENGIIVVLSRRGASVSDILIPYTDENGVRLYRSIVLKGGNENHFGSVRFGFHDQTNSMNMISQLPSNYPFINSQNEDWIMYADVNKPHRVRFVHPLMQIIYEFAASDLSELRMTTMIATSSDKNLTADPTNNIYFNLRGHGDLRTHFLNISSADPINIANGVKVEQDRLVQSHPVDNLTNINNYFYELNGSGLGKNYIATLSESETKTIVHIFSDHAGLVVDPFGDGVSNSNAPYATANRDVRGVRISPRQSPMYNTISIYGPTSIVYPSQAIHTTWWQFQYDK